MTSAKDGIKGLGTNMSVVAVLEFAPKLAELKKVEELCNNAGAALVLSEVWAKGGEGGEELAQEVARLCEQPNNFEFAYDVNLSVNKKIEAIASKIYRAENVVIFPSAQKQIDQLEKLGLDKVPVCMAKTQYSFSDNPSLLGAPRGWTLNVRDIKISAGAGFIVALTGDIMTMPGLPPVPSAEKIDIDSSGKISGLF
jgi:formate--tetrahydrofolate ligase